MGKKKQKIHIPGTPCIPIPNVSFVRAMSDKEVMNRAKADPDAQPLTETNIRKMKRIK